MNPGDTIVVYIDDELPPGKGMASDVNLHFHGLNVSPRRPADDVSLCSRNPGGIGRLRSGSGIAAARALLVSSAHSRRNQPQVGQGGMSGAIVVEGIDAHVPALAKMPEHSRRSRARQHRRRGARPDGATKGDMDSMASMDATNSGAAPTTANVPCAPEAAGVFRPSIANFVRRSDSNPVNRCSSVYSTLRVTVT